MRALEEKKLGLVDTVSFTVAGWPVKIAGHGYRLIDLEAKTEALKCDLTFQAITPHT